MKLNRHLTASIIICLIILFYCDEINGQNEKNIATAASTYECSSIYWKTPENGACKLRYKELNANSWKEGLDLTYDSRDGEYRGSIIGLTSNTGYQAELSAANEKTQLRFKTRNDNFPIGKITILPAGESDTTIVITQSGTPDAYLLLLLRKNPNLSLT